MCAELHSATLAALVPTPNLTQLGDDVLDRGCYMPNPSPPTSTSLWHLHVVGALIGICLRTKHTLPFELATTVWQAILGQTPTLADYERVDKSTAQRIIRVRDNSDPACPDMSEEVFDIVYGTILDFTIPRSDSLAKVPLKPNSAETLTFANRHEWAALAEAYLLHECDAQHEAIRQGLAQLVPLDALCLFSPAELERLVIGERDWKVADLT